MDPTLDDGAGPGPAPAPPPAEALSPQEEAVLEGIEAAFRAAVLADPALRAELLSAETASVAFGAGGAVTVEVNGVAADVDAAALGASDDAPSVPPPPPAPGA